jgi:hypothetical protein
MLFPLSCNVQRGLKHEGRCEGEAQVLLVKSGQHHFPARRQARDQPFEDTAVAADIDYRRVVLTRVLIGVDARVASGTAAPRRLRLPDGRRLPALGQADARQQPAHHTVANDQIRWHHRQTQTAESHGVIAVGSQH